MKNLMRLLGKILAIFLVLTGILFVVYITNADSKLVEFIYDKLWEFHHSKTIEDHI